MHGGKSASSGRPLIIVTTSEMRHHPSARLTPEGEPLQEEMALGLKYLRAIERAGGIPVVAPPLASAAVHPLLDSAAAVCLSGGPDLEPSAYGDRRHALTGPSWADLDRFELALARAADARGLPILAICRGLQVLNVARGGTLHQHLPEVVGDRITHRQSAPGHQPTHAVTVQSDSRLGAIMGTGRTSVNSFHHQAVARLGRRLRITGRADDDTVEAIEARDREFVVGVQWHAECLADDSAGGAALFAALVAAAQRYRAERPRPALAA